MDYLNGQRLVGIRVDAKNGASEFAFDLGAILQARRLEKDSASDVWTLFDHSNGFSLGVKGNGTFTYEGKDVPHYKKVARPINGSQFALRRKV